MAPLHHHFEKKGIHESKIIIRFWILSLLLAVMTNADDPILTEENFTFLARTFGPRLTLYPAGGHCGNLRYKDTFWFKY